MLAADAPSVTDWMQGWGSILSLAVSTGALVFTGWLLRHEIRVRREEKADADAAQARLVVARIVGEERSGTHPEIGHLTGPMIGIRWRIRNHSQAPIFDVFVSINEWRDDLWGDVVEGEASGTAKCDPPLPFDSYPFDPREAIIEVEFTDAAGLRWRRRMGEPPERVIAPPVRRAGLGRWIPGRRKKKTDDVPF
ncbi:hypothetical protein [Micromonospora sp. NPDC001898]|uniref:DUF3426 domain-containing protein n=1 Tax=Micromonospora rubida TaxID=2697657 RepID=A0ABW7SJX8_9ACTN